MPEVYAQVQVIFRESVARINIRKKRSTLDENIVSAGMGCQLASDQVAPIAQADGPSEQCHCQSLRM